MLEGSCECDWDGDGDGDGVASVCITLLSMRVWNLDSKQAVRERNYVYVIENENTILFEILCVYGALRLFVRLEVPQVHLLCGQSAPEVR